MINIKKTGEHQYLAVLDSKTEELNRNNFYLIKKRLSSYIKPRREITFNIGLIKTITTGGYKKLQELMNMAYTRRCKMKIISEGEALPHRILKMSDKTFKLQKKMIAHI